MDYHLALDCGGTKVLALLYDEDFLPIRQVRVGSVRLNTTSAELVQRNLDQLEEQLFGSERPPIRRLSGVLPAPLVNALKKAHSIETIVEMSEMHLGLYAARLFGDGILTISGTGSSIWAQIDGHCLVAGGYGASISDEGSGYWRSRMALEAAIRDFEGWGEPTLLTEMLRQRLGGGEFRKALFSIYSTPGISPAALIASCSPVVDAAAFAGDAVAQEIIRRAGASLGKQVNALTRKEHISAKVPLTVSGSVWRGHPLMWEEFCRTLHAQDPERPLVVPEFEPIVGALVAHRYQLSGQFTDADAHIIHTQYPEFRFRIPQTERMDPPC